MSPSTREAYLSSQVNTATPQKLHLMLLDGALRFGLLAKQSWDDDVARDQALTRCRTITGELLASVRAYDSEISKQLADIYQFIYLTVVEGQVNADASKIDEAMQVLEVERETWRQVCDKFGAETATGGATLDTEVNHPNSRDMGKLIDCGDFASSRADQRPETAGFTPNARRLLGWGRSLDVLEDADLGRW